MKTLLRHPDDPLLELLLAVVKPFPQSPLGDAEEPGGVPRREIVDVAEHHGKPESIGQRGYDPPYLLPERVGFAPLPLCLRSGIRRGRLQDSRLLKRPETAPFLARRQSEVPCDLPQPGREGTLRPKVLQGLERGYERLLGDVLRKSRVPQNLECCGEDEILIPADDLSEGRRIAFPCFPDEVISCSFRIVSPFSAYIDKATPEMLPTKIARLARPGCYG